MEMALRMPLAFFHAPLKAVARAAPKLSKTLHYGYDIRCAAPNTVHVQRRALCLCNADPCASATPTLMTAQCRSCCHGFTHWAHPTHPGTCHTNNRVQSDTRHGCGNLPVLKVVSLRIAISTQKTFTELVATICSKTREGWNCRFRKTSRTEGRHKV